MEIPLLSVRNLTVSFGNAKAVNDVSFNLKKGQVLGIVGESGSGKSLTALSLIGLLPEVKNITAAGKILYSRNNAMQTDLAALNIKQLNKIRGNEISMIFQDPLSSLNPSMKCGLQAIEPLRYHLRLRKREAARQILQLFEKVKLPDPQKIFESYPHQLSGGQRQRVMIAMAMSTHPRILVADEPTTALDVTVQKEIIQLIRDLQSESGTSVIFISHDLALVRTIADHVLVMNKGVAVEQGEVENIFSNPAHDYTKALIACRPKLGNNPVRLPTVSDYVRQSDVDASTLHPERLFSNEEILKVENLSVHYALGRRSRSSSDAWFRANDNISLSLFKGETLGLVGESGCGKSTLIRAMLQLIKPTSGKVLFDGLDLTQLSGNKMRHLRTRMQIVFQDPYSSLTPTLSVRDALLEPMKEHRIFSNKRERIDYAVNILEKTGLSADDLKKYPHQFSGGQRQRIVIARALVLKPEIVFCDESVSALDVSVQAQVLNLFNDLKDEFGFTYVFISHDMNVVGYMSDRIMVMNKGKIVESGATREVIENPQQDYTKTLIDSIPVIE
ncbi:MAG: ABC transporter ATP-binding protein [Bacteroidetes bacterium GWF2_43_63]|nr:MAG: ABC transporter ATP-binding protein [Bacteroidetes bacterium GWE2_42_42]OFY56253.1 MAG: ABC transporter ATP-binding protein [Bacteroidetes bacterium GWF2_43_63]HBG71929.1 ABC transporter ATP-binding protein [Bacteroidales bacterium]HCB61830.1 ABC transporter ATP-binding protein [Bacteroidales bacterium]HCY23852.1 ABC transporter ATP-binding protein [Bacteroidales bacterium]